MEKHRVSFEGQRLYIGIDVLVADLYRQTFKTSADPSKITCNAFLMSSSIYRRRFLVLKIMYALHIVVDAIPDDLRSYQENRTLTAPPSNHLAPLQDSTPKRLSTQGLKLPFHTLG